MKYVIRWKEKERTKKAKREREFIDRERDNREIDRQTDRERESGIIEKKAEPRQCEKGRVR